MKKVISISLLFIMIMGLLSACQQVAIKQEIYPRIIVAKEPSQSVHDAFKNYLGEYTDLQDALDEIVNRYNTTYDNDDLYNICAVLYNRVYYENGDTLVIKYYSKFFDEVWSDDKFNQKTVDVQKWYANILLISMYQNEMQMESIDFFDKYLATIDDINEKVAFSISYLGNYTDDSNPNQEALEAMLGRAKELEKEYYDDVDDFYKAAICSIISQYADKLNDKETAEIYKETAIQIYEKLENEASKQ